MLRLLEAALQVSSHTDRIDGAKSLSDAKRTQAQVREICAFLTALTVCDNYRAGKALVQQHSFKEHQAFFRTVLEVGRRYKVMNPEKMRGEYGKLVYLLQVCLFYLSIFFLVGGILGLFCLCTRSLFGMLVRISVPRLAAERGRSDFRSLSPLY